MYGYAKTWKCHQIVWPPTAMYILAHFPVQQRGVYPLIGSISGMDNMNFVSWHLKSSGSWMVFKWYSITFHNIGPSTTNHSSNRDWLATELDRILEGMTAKQLLLLVCTGFCEDICWKLFQLHLNHQLVTSPSLALYIWDESLYLS